MTPLIATITILLALIILLLIPRKSKYMVVLCKGHDCVNVYVLAYNRRDAKIIAEVAKGGGYRAIIALKQ